MDKIKKLLAKINHKEREKLLSIIEAIKFGDKSNLDINKIVGTEFFRLRTGKYRIIFHYEDKVIIDAVKLRNENTYKNI